MQNVAGHRDFDVVFPQHVLTLTPDGHRTWVEARIDGGPLERFSVRPGQLTLLPMGQRSRGHTDGLGTRGEVLLFFEPELITEATGADVDPSRLGLVRSMDLRNPSILQAMAALRREVERPGLMGRVYTESLVWLTLAELVRHHSTLSAAPKPAEHLPSRRLARIIDYIDAHLGEDLSLLTLAAEAGVSPAHLARAFKRAMGRSVHQYLAGTILGSHRHMCGFFDGPEDEYRVTLPFVHEGLERKELAFHIVDPANRASYARRFEQDGIPLAELEKSGQFELRTWPDTYLRRGEFDADAMLALVEEMLRGSKPSFPLVRLVAHMDFPNAQQQTWDDWVAYEARLNWLLQSYPDPMICAYETSKCNGRLVMDLLRTHPVVIAGGLLHSNPFFVPPYEFLAELRDRVISRTEPAAGPAGQQGSLELAEQKRNIELREGVLAIVSHDLRGPLSAIMMSASLLRGEPRPSAEAVRVAERILASAQRMEGIIRDLLDLTKVRLSGGIEVTPTRTDAHALCARIVEELQAGHPGREIRLRVDGDGTGLWDASRLEQVVSNLAANALQYGPEDAPVTLESRGGETHWTLLVHNLGEPIPPDVLPYLFDPFRRGRDPHEGLPGRRHLGIGLFIVREVVHAHGGTIDVASRSGEGTRFVVRLPRGRRG